MTNTMKIVILLFNVRLYKCIFYLFFSLVDDNKVNLLENPEDNVTRTDEKIHLIMRDSETMEVEEKAEKVKSVDNNELSGKFFKNIKNL